MYIYFTVKLIFRLKQGDAENLKEELNNLWTYRLSHIVVDKPQRNIEL